VNRDRGFACGPHSAIFEAPVHSLQYRRDATTDFRHEIGRSCLHIDDQRSTKPLVITSAESCVRDDAWHAKSCLGKYVNSDGGLPADPIRVKHSHDATMDVHLNIERVHFLQDCQCFFFLPLVCPENSMKNMLKRMSALEQPLNEITGVKSEYCTISHSGKKASKRFQSRLDYSSLLCSSSAQRTRCQSPELYSEHRQVNKHSHRPPITYKS